MFAGQFTTLTITNVIPSGAAFGMTYETGDSCFIPTGIMHSCGASAGDTVDAILIDNPNESARGRTPYMARYIKPNSMVLAPIVAPAPEKPVFNVSDVIAHVRNRMQQGGVWTVSSMFKDYMNDPDATRDDNLQVYNAISAYLRKMFDGDECAKWSMWTKASQSKPGREWFSCFPSRVDVDEWAEE